MKILSKYVKKVNLEKNSNYALNGCVLCVDEEKSKVILSEYFYQTLIENADNEEQRTKFLKQSIEIYNRSNLKPSFLFVDSNFDDCLLDTEQLSEDKFLQLNEKSKYLNISSSNISKILEKISISRTDNFNVPPLFVVIPNLEKSMFNKIDVFLTIARSRKIYFLICMPNADNENKIIDEGIFEIIKGNCLIFVNMKEKQIKIKNEIVIENF